jgi:DNA repair photolyase
MQIIYEPSGAAREYAPLACNLFRGCVFGCKYCYAPRVLRRDRAEYHSSVVPVPHALLRLDQDCRILAEKKDTREILFCFTSDPFQNYRCSEISTQALQVVADNGLRATVLTKAGTRLELLGLLLIPPHQRSSETEPVLQ